MTELSWLLLYSALIVGAALLGGYLPFLGRVSHGRLQLYLSLSAGVMLGASFFHVMPEAFEKSGDLFGWWISLGVVGLFCIERFIAPHSHEEANGHKHDHNRDHSHEHHDHAHDNHGEHRPAAPAVAGWMAVLGLTIHTFMNGVGLAGAVHAFKSDANLDHASSIYGTLPGFAMFLAIVLHKPADALAISTVLRRKQVSPRLIGMVLFGFALTVAAGALAFYFTTGKLGEQLNNQITGAALAFSAGTFLFIALSDLLPEVQFHRHDRGLLFLAFLAGVLFMGGIGVLEDLGKTKAEGDKPAAAASKPE